MRNVSAHLANLSHSEKRTLLAQLLQEKAIQAASVYPLSYGQRALLFLHQLAPHSAAYNIIYAARLRSDVDVHILQQTVAQLIRRYAVLSTIYTVRNGEPVQQVQTDPAVPFTVIDASHWRQDTLQHWLAEEADRPFTLSHGPVIRVHLLTHVAGLDRPAEPENILVLTAHHIAVDFSSLEILVNELSMLYRAKLNDPQAVLPPLPWQYKDYVRWEAEQVASPEGERCWRYWQNQLAEAPTVLDLPTDRQRPPIQTYRGSSHRFDLSAELTWRLRELAKSAGVTPYMTLLGAFQVLLLRYTGQEDFLIGSPMAGRNLPEFEGIVGYLVNPVILRAKLSANPTLQALLQQVRETVLAALEHQAFPFPLLVERLQPLRDPSRSPIVQVMFVWDQPRHLDEFDGLSSAQTALTAESLISEQRGAAVDLALTIFDSGGSLRGSWEYNTDLFDVATIVRLVTHLQTLLQNMVDHATQRVFDLPILTASERHQLLVQWNQTQAPYAGDRALHRLFEAQVERTPNAVAVVDLDHQLTYQELNCRANQLAHHLRALGVGPEVMVGVWTERSLDMVVGLLGILKAGGTYVALDPAYPHERLLFILEDAQIAVVLTQQHLLDGLPTHGVPLVCLDTEWDIMAQENQDNPANPLTSDHLAYLLYTSGSTGQPKGVAIAHRSAVAMVEWAQTVFAPEELAGVLASTSICFDLSVFELFVPLSGGGKVILVENALHLSAAPAAPAVTLINTVPSAVDELLRMDGVPDSVYTVNLAGEPLKQRLVQQIYGQTATRQVFNLYGPSEDTTYSTFVRIERDASAPPTIGRPITNTQVYLLDRYQQPVPVGLPGELYLGGTGLARGYLHRPGLTGEKFVPDPFSARPGARLYRTGDLARYMLDGAIEFLGRIDSQVKLRGFRIELGEIEAVLHQHPAVEAAVVLVRQADESNPTYLAAYVVPNPEDGLTPGDLRRFLSRKLPGYMVPADFVLLDALPLTPNGKIDRQALPARGQARMQLADPFVAPRTPMEDILAGIWAEVLGRNQVGIHDNFYDLGGHSLLATQIVSRVRETFQVELPLRSFLETPTVAGLVEYLQTGSRPDTSSALPPMVPTSRTGPITLSFTQQRLWFFDQWQPGDPSLNVPAAVRLTGQLDVAAMKHSLQEVVRRQDALRTTFTTVAGNPVQVIAQELILPLTLLDLQALSASEQEQEVIRLATEEARRPFDLSHGPLLRTTLLRLGEMEHVLLLTMHHIIADGWSVGVLVREVVALYTAFSQGESPSLPALPIQYADFVHWQQEWMQGKVMEDQMAYWRQQLTGAPSVLELPLDKGRPPIQSYRGAISAFKLSQSLSKTLKALSRQEGVTLFMTLLAAFKTLCHRYTGQDDMIIGTSIANRTRSEVEGLIGCFINQLVLRTDLRGNPRFRELLKRVREVALGAYAHQDLPFEKLVAELQIGRNPSYSPLFQVLFVLQNAPMETIELPGLTVQPLDIDSGVSKFDLTLFMEEKPEGLHGSLIYNTDLFEPATVTRMVSSFRTLLEDIAENPDKELQTLAMSTAEETLQLLDTFND